MTKEELEMENRRKEDERNYDEGVDQDVKDIAEGRDVPGDVLATSPDEGQDEDSRLLRLQAENAKKEDRLKAGSMSFARRVVMQALGKDVPAAVNYGIGDVDGSKSQSAVDLVNRLDAEKRDEAVSLFGGASQEKPKGTPGTDGHSDSPEVAGRGAFGTLRNEHFADRPGAERISRAMGSSRRLTGSSRKGEEEWKERYDRRWDERAARDQAHDRYVANKTSIRRYGIPLDQRTQGGGMSWDGVVRDQRSARTSRALGYTAAAVQANKDAIAQEKSRKEEQAKVAARRNLSIYDAILAAGNDLMNNADNKPVQETRGSTGYILQDEKGRQTTVAEPPKELPDGTRIVGRGGTVETPVDGSFVKTGRVSSSVLQNLNQQILKSGADYAITGIIAQQRYGANAPKGGVEFKVRIRDNDGSERFMTLNERELQQRLIRNHKAAGNDGDVNDIAITAMEAALGGDRDYSGYRKTNAYISARRGTGRTFDEQIALEKLREQGRNNRAQMRGTGSYVGDRRIGRLQAERKYWEGQRGVNPDAEKMLVDINAELAEQLELSRQGRENNGGVPTAAPGAATAPVGANGTQTAPAQVPVSKSNQERARAEIERRKAEVAAKKKQTTTANNGGATQTVETSDKYTTRLTSEEESEYQKWRATLPKALQYEGDYDLRGYWKDPETKKDAVEGDHFIDKYKKPNHPTFSNESQYAVGEDAKRAGHWEGDRYVKPGEKPKQTSADLRRNNGKRMAERIKADDDAKFNKWWIENGRAGMRKEVEGREAYKKYLERKDAERKQGELAARQNMRVGDLIRAQQDKDRK